MSLQLTAGWRRVFCVIGGVIGILLCLLSYRPGVEGFFNQLLVPAAAAVSFWLVMRNPTVIAIAVCALAIPHIDFGEDNWISSIAYPVCAVAAGIVLLFVWGQRLRTRINATHDARWSSRSQD